MPEPPTSALIICKYIYYGATGPQASAPGHQTQVMKRFLEHTRLIQRKEPDAYKCSLPGGPGVLEHGARRV